MSDSNWNPRQRRDEQAPVEPALGVQLPQDIDAERAVLGAILLQPGILREIGTGLDQDDFYLESHQRIFVAMVELEKAAKAVDQLVVISWLKEHGSLEIAGGMAYVAGLVGSVPHAEYWGHYASILRSKRSLRDLIAVTRGLHSSALGPVDSAERLLDEAAKQTLELSMRGSTSSTISTASLAAGSTARPPISTRRPIECTPAASCVGCATPDSLSSATAFEMAAMMAGALPLFTTPSIIM